MKIGEKGEMIPEVNPANTGNILRDSEMNDMNTNVAVNGKEAFFINHMSPHVELGTTQAPIQNRPLYRVVGPRNLLPTEPKNNLIHNDPIPNRFHGTYPNQIEQN